MGIFVHLFFFAFFFIFIWRERIFSYLWGVETLKFKIMTSFTNWSGKQITYKPFFQTSLNVWRIARYEDGELDMVHEQISFDNEDDCMLACMHKVSAILAINA